MKISPIVNSVKAIHPKNIFRVELACDTRPDESATRKKIADTMLKWIRFIHCELGILSRSNSTITTYRKLAVVSEKPRRVAL